MFPALHLSELIDTSDLKLQICLEEGKEVSVDRKALNEQFKLEMVLSNPPPFRNLRKTTRVILNDAWHIGLGEAEITRPM